MGAITSETRGQNSWLNYGPYGETNRTASVEDQCRQLQARVAELEARPEVRVEVPVIPPQVQETLADIAARAEALAAALDEKRG